MPLLVEKYRPHDLESMVGFVPSFSIDEDMPHLLLSGGAGTGKTTLARIVIKMLQADSLILNASNERGIETIRQKVIDFASTRSTNNNIKIIFLDESDQLTTEAQTALRNTMETFSRNCRFILTANYINRIIEPIQSRCISIKFDNIPKEKIVERLQYICDTEKIPYEIDALNKIVERTGTDIRSAINKIEELKSGVLLSKLQNETAIAQKIFEYIKKKEFVNARQAYLDNNPENEQFLKDLHEIIFNSSETDDYKRTAILEICEAYKNLKVGSWPQIIIESMFIKMIPR